MCATLAGRGPWLVPRLEQGQVACEAGGMASGTMSHPGNSGSFP